MFLSAKNFKAEPEGSGSPRECIIPVTGELVDPLTGEVLDEKDVDALISSYERVAKRAAVLYSFRQRLALLLAGLTEGENRTRRIRGRERLAKVEMPDDSYNQGILKEAWNSFPALRDETLAIESIRVKKREWAKLATTAGPPDFETFKGMIAKANQGPSGTPRITVER